MEYNCETSKQVMANVEFYLKRILEHYTQEKAAQRLGVSLKTIHNALNGLNPRRETLRKIKELYDELTGNKQETPPDEKDTPLRDKDEIIQLLKEKIQRLESERTDSKTVVDNQELQKAYLKALHEHLVKVRAKLEGKDLGVYIQESAKLIGEFLTEDEIGEQTSKGSNKKPYKVK